jgi:membrane-bound lytic murein transglycosylase D
MKTMLTSQVPIFLCSLTLLMAQPALANPGQPSSDGAKTAQTTTAVKTNFNLSSKENVSFALPGRQVRKFVDAYIKSNDDCLSMIKSRSKRPFEIIDSILESYGVPAELRYLAVIESELKSTALSRVGARGPWQLMAGTARELGLKVNGRRDERTNYYKSTRAAALYLRDLHNEFKDWLLVLAAYNAGPVPVYRAIHRSHSRNFWALERYLPAESRQHVKRFIATACYFNQPVPNDVEPMPNGVDLAGDGVQTMKVAEDGTTKVAGDGTQTMVKGNGTCDQSAQAGFAAYSDIVKTDMREISILDIDGNSQYDNQGSGDHSGTVQSGHSVPAFKIEQCLAWNEPAAY